MSREWEQIEVEDKILVPFEWRDTTPGGGNLGRAEFHVCLKFKKGQVSEFWVYPYQTRMDTCWHYSGGDIYFTISSYQELEDGRVWLVSWCKEHKTHALHVYPPDDAKFLEIDRHGISFWKSDVYRET